LDQNTKYEVDGSASLFIDKSVSSRAFRHALNKEGGGPGWLSIPDRYAIGSDGGEWVIYCERMNEIAVIAMKDDTFKAKADREIKHMNAKEIDVWLASGTKKVLPFDSLISEWQEKLLDNYGAVACSRARRK
jgi:hypothetical protein